MHRQLARRIRTIGVKMIVRACSLLEDKLPYYTATSVTQECLTGIILYNLGAHIAPAVASSGKNITSELIFGYCSDQN